MDSYSGPKLEWRDLSRFGADWMQIAQRVGRSCVLDPSLSEVQRILIWRAAKSRGRERCTE